MSFEYSNNQVGVEELDLDREWADILGDESELDFLAFAGRSV